MNSYNSEIKSIKRREEMIACCQAEVDTDRLKLFGKESSMFYGLKYPSLYKIFQYISDEYNVSHDIMMDMIYKMVVKKYRKENLKNMISRMPPACRVWDEVKERVIITERYTALSEKGRGGWVKKYRCRDFPPATNYNTTHLYFGEWRYYMCGECPRAPHYYPKITWKPMTQSANPYMTKTLTKKEITDYLDKIGVSYRRSMKKQELYTLLLKI